MCLIGIAWQAHPDFPLIVAANRDEFHSRATTHSAWWREAPHILAGRDLQSGGTWMGITRTGRFAAVTNFREGGPVRNDAPSRGALVERFLATPDEPDAYLTRIVPDAHRFNGFNLLAGTAQRLCYFGNRGGAPQSLTPGIYGLSNALLDTEWPKVTALKSALGAVLGKVPAGEAHAPTVSAMLPELFSALRQDQPWPDETLPQTGVPLDRERWLSSALIVSPTYGTRASTVLCIGRDGTGTWEERSYSPDARVTRTVHEAFRVTPA